MKVLIVIDSLGSGGAERSTEVLANYLQYQQIEFCILCLDHRDIGVQKRMLKKNYNIQFLKKESFISQARQIAKIIKEINYDLVHSILFRSNLRTRFASLFTDFTHLESLVNTTYSKERFADVKVNQSVLKFYKKLDRFSASWGVNHFHSITEAVKDHYISEVGLNSSRVTVIPRGRKAIIDHYHEKSSLTNEKVNLINVGRHEFQKGQIFLLKAVKELRAKGLNFHLSIYGREGSVTTELKQYIKENALEDLVVLQGYSSNIPKLLIESDIFVFPSLYEGLGGALIEAQAAGLPICCNDIPVFHEVVTPENANFFSSHDTSSIVRSLTELIENKDLRREYGIKSLENYKSNFQESVNNKRLMNLYFDLIEERTE